MLVLMTFTMLVTAPIMAVGGIVMAMREGFVAVVAAARQRAGAGARRRLHRQPDDPRLPPACRSAPTTSTGCCASRSPGSASCGRSSASDSEAARFATTNDELTDAAIWVGQWMALMFPTVMFVFNASSVAVLWFGAGPVDDGSLQIGSLTAFLSYLMQILMAVMMATFVARAGAACGGVRRSHRRGARHGVVGRPAAAPGHRRRRRTGASSCAT